MAVSQKFATFADVKLRPCPRGQAGALKISTTMSKGNMLLGHARGKVGDVVFSRVNGQQITRARAAVVRNPQTEKQMIQRIILNTVIQAYSRMAEICDHSFEGVAVGQDNMSKFMRENMSILRKYVADYAAENGSFDGCYAFVPKGLNMFTPNPWKIATGQLPEVVLASVSPTDGAEITIVSAGVIPTYGEIITSLGLQRGDQMTFIGQELYTDGRAAFKFARVILDPREADGTQADITTPFLANGVVNKPSPRNEGADIVFTTEANKLIFDLGENSQYGAAVIVSRQKADGSWLRSNSAIQLAENIPYALVGAMDMQEAIDYAMSGGIELESDRYLNNAVRGKKIVAAPQPEPEPDTAELTSLTLGAINLLDSSAEAARINVAFTPAYVGTNLAGSYLYLGARDQTIGASVDMSTVGEGNKYLFTGNSGNVPSLLYGSDPLQVYLVSEGKIVQVGRKFIAQD